MAQLASSGWPRSWDYADAGFITGNINDTSPREAGGRTPTRRSGRSSLRSGGARRRLHRSRRRAGADRRRAAVARLERDSSVGRVSSQATAGACWTASGAADAVSVPPRRPGGCTARAGAAALRRLVRSPGRQAGMSAAAAVVMSATTFAGSAQFAAAGVLEAGGGALAAIVAASLLNARYLPIGVAVARDLPGRGVRRLVESQLIVDESWAIAGRSGRFERPLLIGAGVLFYVLWVGGTAVGVALRRGARRSRRDRPRRGLPRALPGPALAVPPRAGRPDGRCSGRSRRARARAGRAAGRAADGCERRLPARAAPPEESRRAQASRAIGLCNGLLQSRS